MTLKRSRRFSNDREAMIAGTVQPNPKIMGINARPESPSLLIIPSMTYATRAIYPLSSRKANARNRMKMFGRKVRIPPTPAMMPSTSRERSTSLTPTAISPSLINADRLSIPNSRNPFSQSPMVKVRKNTAAMTTRKIGMLQNLCVNTRSAFSVKAS